MECCLHVCLVKYVTFLTRQCHYSTFIHVIIPLTQDGATPLFIASQHGHSDVVNTLIRTGAGVNMAKKVRKILSVRTALSLITSGVSLHCCTTRQIFVLYM